MKICIFFFKSSKNLGGIFYQMDHIWWAPNRLKKTFALIFLEKLAILLQQDFLKTLYVVTCAHSKACNPRGKGTDFLTATSATVSGARDPTMSRARSDPRDWPTCWGMTPGGGGRLSPGVCPRWRSLASASPSSSQSWHLLCLEMLTRSPPLGLPSLWPYAPPPMLP